MRLKDYIEKHGDSECARIFGVKERTAASWRRLERMPRPEQARKIVAATGGEVGMSGIYTDQTEAAA